MKDYGFSNHEDATKAYNLAYDARADTTRSMCRMIMHMSQEYRKFAKEMRHEESAADFESKARTLELMAGTLSMEFNCETIEECINRKGE